MVHLIKNTYLLLLLLLVFFFTPSPSEAYQLVPIIGVSNTEKTFYIRLGLKDGITPQMEATFTNDNISLVAQAIDVTREFSIWKIAEPYGKMPFIKNQIVTFNFATERVWMMDPDQYLTMADQYHGKELRRRAMQTRSQYPHGVTAKLFGLMGVAETVSVQSSSDISGRSGGQVDLLYHYFHSSGFQFGLGGRYEREVVNAPTVTVVSERMLMLGQVSYYFLPMTRFPFTYMYAGVSAGTGTSRSSVGPASSSGPALLFPAAHLGIEYLFPKAMTLFLEGGWETLSTKESFANGKRQDTTEVNAKIGGGFSVLYD